MLVRICHYLLCNNLEEYCSQKVDELIRQEQYVTVTGITAEVGIWHCAVWEMVKIQDTGKFVPAGFPCLLMEKCKCKQTKCFHTVAEANSVEGSDCLHSLVISDETWFYHFDLETK
jgi:hypothetical protein